jgi:hypothetical protein
MSIVVVALAVIALLLLTTAGAVAAVLVLMFRRSGRHAIDPDDLPSPLERARAAASALGPPDWEEFRHWVAERRPPSPPPPKSRGDGITR